MKTIFSVGFQGTQDQWSPRTVSGVFLGQARAHVMGDPLTGAEVDQYTAKIAAGRQKLAQLRKWIASRIDADPMLAKTFNDSVVQYNFWDHLDNIVGKDQWYVDQTEEMIKNPSSSDYDIPGDYLARTDEWSTDIDNLMWAMNNYGGKPLTPVTGAQPGVKPGVKPGVTPTNPLLTPPESKILGVPQNTFVVGAGLVAIAGIVTYALVS